MPNTDSDIETLFKKINLKNKVKKENIIKDLTITKDKKEDIIKDLTITKDKKEEQILLGIIEIFEKYKQKFLEKSKNTRLTEYEKAIGFTELSRIGAKQFANQFGYFMEDIYSLSPKFYKIKIGDKQKGGNDGENKYEYFECKNRHDTMKQSTAFLEIKPKLELAISENKNFKLLILIDNKFMSKNIPLHSGNGLKNIENINGYNKEKHRWISGDEVYKYLFENYNWALIKLKIIELLISIDINK